MKMDDDYIKREAGKPCYWLDDGTFDLVSWTNAMTQQASDRAGSKINTLKYDLDHARLEVDRLRKKLAATPQPPAVSAEPVAWQSIETAPKDGTVVLVCQETEPGFWEFEQAWWSHTWGFGGGNCTNKPTHWMPLPSPPSNAAMQKGTEK